MTLLLQWRHLHLLHPDRDIAPVAAEGICRNGHVPIFELLGKLLVDEEPRGQGPFCAADTSGLVMDFFAV